jgi:AMMECR1 domain-containing protein
VAARYGWSREEFLGGICEKAGLPEGAWTAMGVELYGFETEEWSEEV